MGGGIPYIAFDGKKTELTLYSWKDDSFFSEIIGQRDEIFWMTANITDDEVVFVDNNDKIYYCNNDKMDLFENVTDNIMDVRRIGRKNLVVSQVGQIVYISLYSEDFSKLLNRQEIDGSFCRLFVSGDSCYISLLDLDNFNSTKVYKLFIESFELVTLLELEISVDIYPFEYDNDIYLYYNEKINSVENIKINKLYRITEDELQEVCCLGDKVCKIICWNEQLLLLMGSVDTSVISLDVDTGKMKEVYYINQEQPKGMYVLDKKLYIISERAIYYSDDNKLTKIKNMENLLYNNYN